MADYIQTFKQALKGNLVDLLKPSSYRVTHRLNSVNELPELMGDYDIFFLDRDCTLQDYHGDSIPEEFREAVETVAPMSEIISNSSFNEFMRLGGIFSNIMPVNKLVLLKSNIEGMPNLLRMEDNVLKLFCYNLSDGTFTDESRAYGNLEHAIGNHIIYNFKKPDPLVIFALLDYHSSLRGDAGEPRALMLGDRYMTDIACGNLAGIDTAKVKPYMPGSDPMGLKIGRYLLDAPVGAVMSRIAGKK